MLTLFSYLYRIVYIWVGKGSKREEQRCRCLNKTWHKITEMYSLFIVDIVGLLVDLLYRITKITTTIQDMDPCATLDRRPVIQGAHHGINL
jgi:hypothetical protein